MAGKSLKALLSGVFGRRWSKSRKKSNALVESETQSDVVQQQRLDESNDPIPSESGTGSVYWGQLPDGTQIAVKRLNNNLLGDGKEFAVEAEKMGKMQHKNVLRLRGYCVEGLERIIVYDFVPMSSLLAHLHGAFSYDDQLDWKKRVRIALGCAEGLLYLHNQQMIHGDIKSSNVLLSDSYEPLYTDYGVSALMKSSVIKGKSGLGYTAPECSNGQAATKQSDVFSFGILILELISGRRPMEKVEFSLRQHIVDWAEPLILDGRLDQLVDPKLGGSFVDEELKKLVFVATICAQTSSSNRPSMMRVAELLSQEMPAKQNEAAAAS